jgi:hypothetical protein
MAKLGISTGIVPDDGTGDSLLDGAVKINSNFDDIYTYFGDGTNLTFTGGVSSQWVTTGVGIHTLSNVGIGTTNPRFTLEVGAVGASGTTLFVNGDARVTGIVTIGPASITLNGISNIINVGSGVTINGSTGTIKCNIDCSWRNHINWICCYFNYCWFWNISKLIHWKRYNYCYWWWRVFSVRYNIGRYSYTL